MVRVKGKVARQIYNATWYKLRQLAAWKAEVVTVNPAYTTQACSACGFIPDKKIQLDIRTYRCQNCGLAIDRDHNAAINIKSSSERAHVEGLPLLESLTDSKSSSVAPSFFRNTESGSAYSNSYPNPCTISLVFISISRDSLFISSKQSTFANLFQNEPVVPYSDTRIVVVHSNSLLTRKPFACINWK
jgi:hypothetical protein